MHTLINKKYKSIALGLFLFMVLSMMSCTEEIDIEVGENLPRLIVYGKLTTDPQVHHIHLMKSEEYFYNQPNRGVSDANVTLSDGNETILLEEDPDSAGIYKTPEIYQGIPGKMYTLTIENVDINGDGNYETYTAKSEMKRIGPVDSLDLNYNFLFDAWELRLYAYDLPDQEDFYLFRSIRNGNMVSDTLNEWFITDDVFFNGNPTKGIVCQYLQDEKKDEKPSVGDTVTLQIDGITEDYYVFIIESQVESGFSNPLFGTNPANVGTNIVSEGIDRKMEALGFFATLNSVRVSKIIDTVPVGY